jgi:hypothetical protein
VADTPAKDTRTFWSEAERLAVLAGEALHEGVCVTYERRNDGDTVLLAPGGSCSCCGAAARVGDEDEDDWWLVFKAGFCDDDGVFMSRLCGGPDGSGCLVELRRDAARREPTRRDEAASVVSDLLGDDMDGAESMMDDFDDLGMLDGEDE